MTYSFPVAPRRAVLLAALCLLGPAQARPLAEILKTRELRACISTYAPAIAAATPANCRERCQFSGPVYEEVQAFARHLHKDLKVKTLRVDWDEQYFDASGKTDREAGYTPHLLASGQCDLYPTHLTKIGWRLKKLDFVTLFPSRMMVIARVTKRAQLKSASDLAGLRAVVIKNTSFHTWLEEQNLSLFAARPVQIELVATTEEAVLAVDGNAADFTLLDSDVAIRVARHEMKHAFAAFPVGPKDEIGWAFRKQDKDLQAEVAGFFDAQRRRPDSALNDIWKRHFGRSLTDFIALMASVE